MAILQSDGVNHSSAVVLRQNGTSVLSASTTSLIFATSSIENQSGGAVFELGKSLSGNRNCIIDFHCVDSVDFNGRIERIGGTNGTFDITQLGTGNIRFRNGSGTILAESNPANGDFGISGNYFGAQIFAAGGSLYSQSNGNRHYWFTSTDGTVRGVIASIAADGNLILESRTGATTNNNITLLADGNTGVTANVFRHGQTGGQIRMNTGNIAEFHWSDGFYYRVDFNSDVLINASASDLSFKTIEKRGVDDSIDKVKSLSPIRFSYKEDCPVSVGVDSDKSRYGFIAQELQEILPELVVETGKPKDIPEDPYEIVPDPGTFLSYAQDADKQLIALLTSALQNIIERVEILEANLA